MPPVKESTIPAERQILLFVEISQKELDPYSDFYAHGAKRKKKAPPP